MGGRAVAVAAATAVGAVLWLADAGPSLSSASAVLAFRANLATVSPIGACPPAAPAGSDCHARTGTGSVSGLGRITSTYTWFYGAGSDCASPLVKPLATTGQLVVAGKGTIEVVIADGPQCVEAEPVTNEPQEFTITGGSGRYQGASGHGRIERSFRPGRGVESWEGVLDVAGIDFDTTPPVITGAVSRTVKARAGAKRARVKYKPTASDAVDGAVGVTCTPRSGRFFKIGRTTVRCTASDTSGNTSTARFVVTVRR